MSMSEEQRKAASDRMRARHAAKKKVQEGNQAIESANEALDTEAQQAAQQEAGKRENAPTTISQDEYQSLLKQIAELKQQQYQPQQQTPQVNQRGGLIGTFEKYIIDPANYADPRERLAKEARLQRFAFPLNYELGWQVTSTSYETIDGVRVKEPKFTLELNRIVLDEDTGEPTNKRYTICRMVLHEDPEAALVVARDNGLEIDAFSEHDFLDEMRYLRMRDWLVEAFYPPKPSQEKSNKREMVIGNKLVEVWEINSETSETVPFNQLSKKL